MGLFYFEIDFIVLGLLEATGSSRPVGAVSSFSITFKYKRNWRRVSRKKIHSVPHRTVNEWRCGKTHHMANVNDSGYSSSPFFALHSPLWLLVCEAPSEPEHTIPFLLVSAAHTSFILTQYLKSAYNNYYYFFVGTYFHPREGGIFLM